MHTKIRSMIVSALLLTLGAAVMAGAARANTAAIIAAAEMCGGCAKRITAKLEKLSGVADIVCDIQAKTVSVTPAEGKTLAALTLWEAVEEIGKTPKEFAGPGGTFMSRPKT